MISISWKLTPWSYTDDFVSEVSWTIVDLTVGVIVASLPAFDAAFDAGWLTIKSYLPSGSGSSSTNNRRSTSKEIASRTDNGIPLEGLESDRYSSKGLAIDGVTKEFDVEDARDGRVGRYTGNNSRTKKVDESLPQEIPIKPAMRINGAITDIKFGL